MRKMVYKFICIICYILILLWVTKFDLKQILNLREIIYVLIGILLLTIPTYRKGSSYAQMAANSAGNAIMASYIITIIMLFYRIAYSTYDTLLRDVSLCIRPLLYGILAYQLLANDKLLVLGRIKSKHEEELLNESIEDSEIKEVKDIIVMNESHDDTFAEQRKALTDIYVYYGLTQREIEVALLMYQGLTNQAIADELYISLTTVKKHVTHIFEKTGIKGRGAFKELK